MLRLRKLFNLLPAIALACISGLGVVLDHDYDQKLNEVNADTSVLLSNRTITDYHLTFTDYTMSTLTWDWVFDYEINFYHDVGPDNFYFVVNIVNKLPQWSFTYNGVTKYSDYTGNVSETITSSRMTLASTTFNAALTFQVNNISTDGNSYTFEEVFDKWRWITSYKISYQLGFPNSAGFSPSVVSMVSPSNTSMPGGYGILSFSWDSQPTDFNPAVYAPNLRTVTRIAQYNVDYSKSNYDQGYSDGYSTGYNDGFNVGYESGNTTGYNNGYEAGYQAGVDSQQQAITDAYNNGYNAGYDAGFSVDSTAATIFSGILQVGMLPINVLLAIFNFEILGINLSAFISAILTVCLTVIVIRTVTGGKNSE